MENKSPLPLKRIASFSVDHRKIGKGMYISRVDGDVVTYDLRMTVPNAGIYLDNAPLHTVEHLFATYARNSVFSDAVVYVGPMGCRTGFYLLVRDSMSHDDTLRLVRESMEFICSFEGEIPGAAEPECGNFRNHDLPGACLIAQDYLRALEDWNPGRMVYPQ